MTLSEFTQYIKETGDKNQHWRPVYDLCQPCHVRYDRILKTETLDHDNEYVILNHLPPYYRGLGTRGNIVAGGSQAASLSPHGRLLDRFDNATLQDLSFLEDYYKDDLKYFGYSWNYRKDKNSMYHVHSSCVSGADGSMCC